MRVGVWDHMPLLPGQEPGDLYVDHLEQIVEADRLGFDEYWLAEHHFSPHYSCLPAPNLVLAAAAMRARRIRLGVLINVLPFHNPIRLVEEINTLDQLSNGRAMLGLGRGMRMVEYDGFAIATEESSERFFEYLDAVCSLLEDQEPTTFTGRWFACNDVVIAPVAVQRPHVELVLASSTNPRSAEAAARRGMRLAQGLGPDTELSSTLDAYRRARGSMPGAPGDAALTIMRMTCVREDANEARTLGEIALLDLLRAFSGDYDQRYATPNDDSFRHHTALALGGRLGPLTFDELEASGFVLVGDPDGVIDRIRMLERRFGVDCVLASFNFAGLPHSEVMTSMESFAKHVAPCLIATEQTHPHGGVEN